MQKSFVSQSKKIFATAFALACISANVSAAEAYTATSQSAGTKVGMINFKKVIEDSKFGKQEQANFEALKKQMETTLQQKEKTLSDLAVKFEDADYIDSLSPEAEEELKQQFRVLSQELSQIQSQYYQSLNQSNMMILQKLNDIVSAAAARVAKENTIDVILSDESGFYFAPTLDLSSRIVSIMDEMHAKENTTQPTP